MPRKKEKSTIDKQAVAQIAYIYLRVSTEKQRKDGKGLDAQLDDCQAVCQRLNLTVHKIVVDPGLSGKLDYLDRPGLLEAMTACAEGQAGAIVAYNQDRYARGLSSYERVREHAIKHKYKLYAGDRDITSEEQDIPSEALAFVASVERKLIAKRMRGGRTQRAEVDGRGNAKITMGYKMEVIDGLKSVVPDPDTAPIVCAVLRLVMEEKKSYRYVAEWLNAEGYASPYAGKIRENGENKGVPFSGRWSVGQIQKIVNNYILYTTGVKIWNGIVSEASWPILYNPTEK